MDQFFYHFPTGNEVDQRNVGHIDQSPGDAVGKRVATIADDLGRVEKGGFESSRSGSDQGCFGRRQQRIGLSGEQTDPLGGGRRELRQQIFVKAQFDRGSAGYGEVMVGKGGHDLQHALEHAGDFLPSAAGQ